MISIVCPYSRVILGLSGGADSVALLLLLQEQGVEVVAAHCNFQLRGAESARDEAFVRDLCAKKGVKLHVQHFDTRAAAAAAGESIEMAARRLRYAWFEELRQAAAAEAVCTAHHRDDNVETFLLNLVRGSGIDGLSGMEEASAAWSVAHKSTLCSEGNNSFENQKNTTRSVLLRPMLHVSRAEIEAYLQAQSQTFVTDSTNADTVFRRNKIRHEVLPLLRRLNPSIDRTLTETMVRLREARYLSQKGVEHDLSDLLHEENGIFSLPIVPLRRHPARLTLIHRALGHLFPAKMHPQIAALVDAQPGKHYVHGATMVVRGRDAIEWGDPSVPAWPATSCTIDADCIQGALRLRPLQPGDRFSPFGLGGKKLVSDFLADRHVSLLRRLKARALCDDFGVVWLVGYEIDNRVAVTEKTQNRQTISSDDLLK